MRRAVSAILVVALAALVVFFEDTPRGAPIRAGLSEWLAANSLPASPETVAVVELPPGRGTIRALDAALALRAILPCQPRAIVFLDPIAPGEADALLLSKLSDAKVPVVFTANERLDLLPQVVVSQALPSFPSTAAMLPEGHVAGGAMAIPDAMLLIAARQGDRAVASNLWRFSMMVDGVSAANVTGKIPGRVQAGALVAPVDAAGRARINPLASRFVNGIAFDQLLLRTERREQGAISVDLDILFRGRLVAVQNAGETRALGLAALRNRLAESPPPAGLEWIGLVLVATLPWWRGSRVHRALLALGAGCAWVLMSLAIYEQSRVALPLSIMLLLPLLALIPPGRKRRSGEVEQRE